MQNSVFRHVAVRPDRRIKFGTVGTGDHVLRPVVIDATAGEIDDLDRCGDDAGRTWRVGEAYDRIRVGDVECISDQGHSERRVQIRNERRLGVRNAVPIAIPQQDYFVRARNSAAAARKEDLEKKASETSVVIRPLRRVCLSHQNIAVRQDVKPARMAEPARESPHGQSRARDWRLVARPSFRLDYFHHRNDRCLGRRDHWMGPGLRGNWNPCWNAARRPDKSCRGDYTAGKKSLSHNG